MDRDLWNKMTEKIDEISETGPDLHKISHRIAGSESRPFMLGVVAGRLYNSFYYQTRRICGRDPTPAEMDEFLAMVEQNKKLLQRILDG